MISIWFGEEMRMTTVEGDREDHVNDNPIEEVRLTVPISDDPSELALTFRTWVLGLISCCILSFVNQCFSYWQNSINVSSVLAQILSLPLGKLMAATLPRKKILVPFTNCSFSLNPGPFTMKEHVLITIFASCGESDVYALYVITILKAFYHRQLHPIAAMLFSQTTQLLGYGWAGLFRRYLVESPHMWWPENMVQVSLFKALHEKEKRAKGGVTRLQFFLIVLISSFAYYVVPGYLFPSISALSFVCWIWKDSITSQQIGSGLQGFCWIFGGKEEKIERGLGRGEGHPELPHLHSLLHFAVAAALGAAFPSFAALGAAFHSFHLLLLVQLSIFILLLLVQPSFHLLPLVQLSHHSSNSFGLGSFGLDWSTVAGVLGSPLASPLFAIVNQLVGFALFFYVLVPISYSMNAFKSRRFPLISSQTFDSVGCTYNISRILNDKTFDLNVSAYDQYSKLYLSITFAYIYGLSFAYLASSLSYVALFHGKTIWGMWKKTTPAAREKMIDVHARLMKKNYEAVPLWWFHLILISAIVLSIFACEGFGKQLQLPWWGVLMSCGLAFFFTLPVGIIQATTNLQPGLNVITELIIGYMYPGKPLANVAFKACGTVSMSQALGLLANFKLGQYMKIPPKSMFVVLFVGTIIASTTHFATAWWLLSSVKNICDTSLLPDGSPWTCPGNDVFYSASIIWGLVGSKRMFTNQGAYPQMNWAFLLGLLAPVPVWLLSCKYPKKEWIKLIHMPLIIGGALNLPSAKAVNYICWGIVGIFFNWYVYKRYKGWWARYNYMLSAALDAGVSFMGALIYCALQSHNVNGPEWWGVDPGDHCPLAPCPTAPGIVVKGCPVH